MRSVLSLRRCGVDISEQVPNERAALKHKGEFIAEAWFEAEGESPTLVFRVPRERLQIADLSRRLTIEILLEAAAVSKDEVKSWRLADVSHSDKGGNDPELSDLLPAPPPEATHLRALVHRKPPAQAD